MTERTPRRLLPELARILVAAVVGAALLVGYAVLRITLQGERDERRPADAIVVLGAAQYAGEPGAVLRARLEHALALYRDGHAPYLVVTGGKLPGDFTTEADVSRDWLTKQGVAAEAILFENQGRSTLESLRAVAGLFRERELSVGLFVSDRSHMLRVLRIARDEGIDAWGSPTPSSPSDRGLARRTRAVAHEIAGLVAYYVGVDRFGRDEAIAARD